MYYMYSKIDLEILKQVNLKAFKTRYRYVYKILLDKAL